MTDSRHHQLMKFAFAAAFILGAFLSVRAGRLLPLYMDGDARRGFAAAMIALREDTGWGASNFDVRAVACDAQSCEASMDLRYRSNPSARRTERGWTLRWPRENPEAYVLEK